MKVVSCFAAALICLGLAGAEGQDALRLKVLPLDAKGVVGDLLPGDWKVQVGGKDAVVLAQRTPAQTGQEGQKWVFVLLPIRDQDFRQLMLHTIATFMATLPPSDAVLVVLKSAKGLQCLTPGFTTRPSLWAKALDVAVTDLHGGLEGDAETVFTLPASPKGEPQEDMTAITAFLTALPGKKMEKRVEDQVSRRKSVMDSYGVDSLGSQAKLVTGVLGSIEKMAGTLAQVPGEKHVIILSRNEVDDLANPVWGQQVARMSAGGTRGLGRNEVTAGRDVLNTRLQTELMIRDVSLARAALRDTVAGLGLTIHSVGGSGLNYTGAFEDVALASGGNAFRMENELPARLTQALTVWAARYELQVALPKGTFRPAKISVETTRKGLKLFAPTLQ
jgi:hypothetical protein